MYTVQFKSIELDRQRAMVNIVGSFTNGANRFERIISMPFGFTKAQLKQHVRSIIENMESAEYVVTTINLDKNFDYSKTPKESAAEEYEDLLWQIDRVDRLIKNGVKTEEDAQVKLDELRADAKALEASL